MSAGLFGLLDDVATLARMAAASIDDVGAAAGKATAKAAGVVVDDTAVTPQYVAGVAANRELPIVKRIAVGSIRNKLILILPALMVLSQWAEWLLTPILMIGGTYLVYEGAEKVWAHFRGHDHEAHVAAEKGADAEDALVAGAVRTDLILSCEIMVIALSTVADSSFLTRLLTLAVVALVITVVVYGVVALIVKMDDVGLHLAQRRSAAWQSIGRGMVAAMPRVLSVISVVGIVAMLWVGGHIILQGLHDLGWSAVYDAVHHVEEEIHHAVPFGGAVLAWCFNTACSAVIGLVIGLVVLGVVSLLPFGHGKKGTHGSDPSTDPAAHGAEPMKQPTDPTEHTIDPSGPADRPDER
ncbi:DUF808 domain-containing protein [Nocardioides insulae]|uniref:DUF808 domain-containing protein n=1 Tax=Nocardioides insulae TaxID=394734 RepID=UPI0003FFB888|nr:DUF808 domain-containing protein [Nocardioides insulae]